MSDMQPPLALENLPATRAVWKALVILQNPMRTVSRISRVKKITSRLETTMRPDTPTYGRSTIDYALKQLSAHERIYYHANIKAFEAGWQALCTALSIHPCDGKKHFLVLRAHAKAEALGGEHSADAGRIKWSSGNVAVLFPFLDRLAQYERLSAITPDGPRHRYVFVHRHRDGPATHYSHNYTHSFGVDEEIGRASCRERVCSTV